MRKLTAKEAAFVDAFLGPANGNATEAAAQAGYGKSRRSQRQTGYELLTKPDIGKAIAARAAKREKASIADADERDTILSAFARGNGTASVKERIRAIAELNKCTGRHSMKHLHEGKLTLEQVLGESRQ